MVGPPHGKPKTNPPQLKAHALREERSGRLRRAIALLEELLRQAPEDWGSLQRLADLRARNGDRRIAVDLYRRLAGHYERDHHVSRAIAAWRLVLRHDPAFLGTHVKLGELYARQGFRVESRIHYETAIAGLERAGRTREAAEARRALDAVKDGAATPDPDEPPSLDEAEFVAERLVEAKMFRRYNLLQQARDALEEVLQRAPDHAEAREELVRVLRDQGEVERAATPDTDLEDLDLQLLDEECPPPAVVTVPHAEPLDTSIFREHVDTQIDPEDYRARYDLGIAYREMGLVDEAITEFQLAARDPDRLVDCASLMAGCFVEKGLPGLAVTWLERGLAAPRVSDEEHQALRYELGAALELAGDTARALEVFTDLFGEAAGHRDVAERVRSLRALRSGRSGP